MKTFFALMLILSSLPAFAQYRSPNQCQVAAMDRYNRIIATFRGSTFDPVCRDGMRVCEQEVRRRGWYDVRCVVLRNRW